MVRFVLRHLMVTASYLGHVARRPAVILVSLVVLTALLVTGYVTAYTPISPVDELQHIDYVERARNLGVARSGDRIREPAMRAQACRGIDLEHQASNPDCDAAELSPQDFQEDGYNTAFIHPPTYYYATAILGKTIGVAPGIRDWVTASRITGALWLASAVVLTWFLMAACGISIVSRVPLLVVMITAPITLHSSSVVSPDATALAAGAGVLLAVVHWERGRLHWVIPAFISLTAVALKTTNAVGVLVAFIYLAVRFLQGRRQWPREMQRVRVSGGAGSVDSTPSENEDRGLWIETTATTERGSTTLQERTSSFGQLLRVVTGMLAGVLLVSVVWLGSMRAMQLENPSDTPIIQRQSVDSIGYDEIRAKLTAGFTPIKGGHIPPFLATSRAPYTIKIWANAMVAAGVVAGLALSAPRSRLRAVAIASITTALLVGPLLVITNYLSLGILGSLPSRYALAALPGLLVTASVALELRVILVVAYALAGFMAFSVGVAMF